MSGDAHLRLLETPLRGIPALGTARALPSSMLRASIVLIVLALVAAILGFGGFAASLAFGAKIAFVVFLVLAVVSFATGRR